MHGSESRGGASKGTVTDMSDLVVYPLLTLADVLTADELTRQPFAADTILNGWIMGEWFARMSREERRAYVKNAIEFALHGRAALPDALAVLVRCAAAPVPRQRNQDSNGG